MSDSKRKVLVSDIQVLLVNLLQIESNPIIRGVFTNASIDEFLEKAKADLISLTDFVVDDTQLKRGGKV